MQRQVRNYIQEIIQLLNDEALFHQREIPGDQDDFEDRAMMQPDPVARHDLYSSIDDMIGVYDKLGDDYTDAEITVIVKEIKAAAHKLKSKVR